MKDRVLITGVSGFIGSHIAADLLGRGYKVRGTVRSLDKGQRVAQTLEKAGVDITHLECVKANLLEDEGWDAAVKDCRYIQHIASPFPMETPQNRESLVPAARAGAQRVLENGFSAEVERIVMTSSIVSMIGQPGRGRHMQFGEHDWSDPDWSPLKAYAVSKTRAELSAWAYVKTQGFEDRFVTVCPGFVLGPDLYHNAGTSLEVVSALLDGEFPFAPKLAYPIVDVRDVAAIHCQAMTAGSVGGRRLIAASQTVWMLEIANIIREAYPDMSKLPRMEAPNFMLKLASLFDDRIRNILPDMGVFFEPDAAYVTTLTQVVPRPAKEAILAAAHSLMEQKSASMS